MTKRIEAKKKVSRALGVSLWGRKNDPFLKRSSKPGQHGSLARRETNHGIHLKAKQKVKKYYDMKESQFRTLFDKSKKIKGNTEDSFAGLLESRLASVIYRANIAPTIQSARQIVSHKHVMVNDKVVNIPSYSVKPNDVIKLVEKSKKIPLILESVQSNERSIPPYLEVNPTDLSIKFLNRPFVADIPYPFEVEFNLIIEFYSK
ncbi:MAG: 30S ribosomal protein S4 [Rickettsiales bacterium]|jgi:small subunit ribosomal protein S4|nr:30S ribosomal protein S4 [Rickettsiales bacterium]